MKGTNQTKGLKQTSNDKEDRCISQRKTFPEKTNTVRHSGTNIGHIKRNIQGHAQGHVERQNG